MGLYLSIGIVVGAVAGYFGGWIDILISRIIEVVMVFPSFFLILTLVALSGPSIYMIMVVIGLTGWPSIARLIRGEVLKQRSMDYVTAARPWGPRTIADHFSPHPGQRPFAGAWWPRPSAWPTPSSPRPA